MKFLFLHLRDFSFQGQNQFPPTKQKMSLYVWFHHHIFPVNIILVLHSSHFRWTWRVYRCIILDMLYIFRMNGKAIFSTVMFKCTCQLHIESYSLNSLVIGDGHYRCLISFYISALLWVNLLCRIILGMRGMCLISSSSLAVSSTSFILRWMWVKTIENAEFCSVMLWTVMQSFIYFVYAEKFYLTFFQDKLAF